MVTEDQIYVPMLFLLELHQSSSSLYFETDRHRPQVVSYPTNYVEMKCGRHNISTQGIWLSR